MIKNVLTLLLFCSTITSWATNYYVSALTGNDSNNGLSSTTAFYSLQQTENLTLPGDTIFIMNGVYINNYPSSNILDVFNSGTANQWITYKNYPNHNPIIQLSGNNWSGINIQGADYITIDGITVIGNNDSISLAYAQTEQNNTSNSATSGNGIGCTSEYGNTSNKPHHIVIKNCTVSKCGGGGIYTYNADYITIENNTVYECGWYSPYGNSGISLYQNWNSDNSTSIKNFVIRNTCYRNENYIPFYAAGSITDGNGIIIDDARNTQNNSILGIYLGATYIANNVVFDNGGRGIHCYLSDNVIIVNNTCYKNCQSPAVQDGEITAFSSGTISVLNCISNPDNTIPPIASFDAPNLFVDYNLWATNSSLANPIGTNTFIDNPSFILPTSNASQANFMLQSSSNAINNGTFINAPTTDKDNNTRIGNVDIGAYEYQNLLSNTIFGLKPFSLHPNPASESISIELENQITKLMSCTVTNMLGQKVKSENVFANQGRFSICISELSSGVYFISLDKNLKGIQFIKK